MNTKLFNIVNITPKRRAILNYLRVQYLTEKHDENIKQIINSQEGLDTFSYDEYELLVSNKNEKERKEVDEWNNIISMTLNMDISAQKYFYQTVSLIFFSPLLSAKSRLFLIRYYYNNFLSTTFSVCLLNQIFFEQIELRSPALLDEVLILEKEAQINNCLLFRYEYLNNKKNIIKDAKEPVEEIIDIIKDYEFISSGLFNSFVDKTDQFFIRSLGLS